MVIHIAILETKLPTSLSPLRQLQKRGGVEGVAMKNSVQLVTLNSK